MTLSYILGVDVIPDALLRNFSSKKIEILTPVIKWLVPTDMVGLLIIGCLTSRPKHFIHIHEENKFNSIKITIQI